MATMIKQSEAVGEQDLTARAAEIQKQLAGLGPEFVALDRQACNYWRHFDQVHAAAAALERQARDAGVEIALDDTFAAPVKLVQRTRAGLGALIWRPKLARD